MARRVLLLGALLLLVVAGVLVVLSRNEDGCGVPLPEIDDTQPALVDVADLAPSGSIGEERQPVLDAVNGLGEPFGQVLSGRFFGSEGVPVLVPFGDQVLLASDTTGGGSFRAVTLPDGEVEWGREYDGGPARGGLVGDSFVVLVGGAEPSLVALDRGDGSVESCLTVPSAGGAATTVLTDQAGSDVVAGVAPLATALTLSRIEPGTGDLRWERRLDDVIEAGAVTVSESAVVVGRLAADPVRRAELAAAGGITSPMLTAYSLADGEELWRYPTAKAASTAVSVVDGDTETGLLVALTAQGTGPSPQRSRAELVALDDAGAVVWSTPVGPGFWNAELQGSLVVAQGADPRGGAQLRAFSAATGQPRWEISARDLPAQGRRARVNFGPAVEVGDTLVVPAPNGLLLLDPDTGDFRRLDSEVPIEQVLPAGDHALIRTENALLVVALRGA